MLGATRPHFFALPIGAAFAGVASTGLALPETTLFLLAFIAGGGWAAGQLLNDVLDREADAIDAPERAAVRGLLPARTTILLALAFGLSLLLLLTQLTPHGLLLGGISMLLILTYNQCKAIPLAGNLSHGALIACAAVIGAAVARPSAALLGIFQQSAPAALVVGGWAALYLQGNYEKDVRGDAAAGYQTLAHLLTLRQSALLRAGAALLGGVFLSRTLPNLLHAACAAVGAGVVFVSALRVARANRSDVALWAYRWTVHGAILGMLALGGPALSVPIFIALVLLSLVVAELAFRRSPNP